MQMKFTRHARDQMRQRNITPRQIETALSRGKDVWRKGALLIMHRALRVIYCPFSGCVITAWWQGSRATRTRQGRGRR